MEGTAETAPTVLSKSEFARMINVTPGRVSQYIAEGKISGGALAGEGRSARIVVAVALDQLERSLSPGQRLGNGKATLLTPPGDASAPVSPAAPRSSLSSLTSARAETEFYRARLARLDYEQKAGQLVRVDELQQAAIVIAEQLVRQLEMLPALADDLAGVVAKEGVVGLRNRLKAIVRDIRAGMARSMSALVAGATDAEAGEGDDVEWDRAVNGEIG